MGIIAFECICGHVPFRSPALGELVLMICTGPIPRPSSLRDVPPAFDAWFFKAVNREPDQRFQTAREAVSALRAALLGTSEGTESSAAFRIGISPDSGSIQVLPVSGPQRSALESFPRASPLNETTGRGALSLVPPEAPSKRGRLALVGLVGGVVLGLLVWLIAARSERLADQTPPAALSSAQASPAATSAAVAPAPPAPARASSTAPSSSAAVLASSSSAPPKSAVPAPPRRTSAPRPAPLPKRPKRHSDDLGI